MARALGFTRDQTPRVATLHRVLQDLNHKACEGVLGEMAQQGRGPGEPLEWMISGCEASMESFCLGLHLVASYVHRARL